MAEPFTPEQIAQIRTIVREELRAGMRWSSIAGAPPLTLDLLVDGQVVTRTIRPNLAAPSASADRPAKTSAHTGTADT
jgi:hypothetical protein